MAQHRPTSTDRGLRRGFALAWVSWVAGLAAWAYAVATGFTLGGGLSPAEETRVLVGATVAIGLTTVLPAMGLLAALVNRRVAAALGLGVAVALALVPVLLIGPAVARDWRDRTAPDPPSGEPNGCVAFSGGSNTCPGG
ncbi:MULTISPECIES: hypothetical protein [unclassified Aeromicrobium]|uniref:hypothetical protein n=1 Tax=unclassified Aeromicrobium TaxID=2633570 RepID=UPI000700ED9B|nr:MULTISPECIES: hypothetical protein [unclassified Aeromicrobium]KQO42805.1 hypothetical protein ASF05_00700 [Aeromicrobium sp. Leaf245]KQP26788.1 hypothetical protein ASF38_07180 [Aeromicrobium sp. Leaf272]